MKKLILLSGYPCVGKTTVDKGNTNFHWLHLPPYPTDIVINTDNKPVQRIAQELNRYIKR